MYKQSTNVKKLRDSVELSKLKAELKLIENEEKNEIKMHNSQARRIRDKYSKLGVIIGNEATQVKMYQTHCPGFCYKRNGVHKNVQTVSKIPSIEFEQLKNLLFTNEEVDVDKILCLHMLSTHKADTLKMPKLKNFKDTPKENMPIERLIKRSKKINKENRNKYEILKELPVFVIDVSMILSATTIDDSDKDDKTEELLYRDTRLNGRLLVNEKIKEILTTALEALKEAKSEKFEKLIKICQDKFRLKKIFSKLNIQDFLKLIRTYSLITSCDCYYLTPKIKEEPIHLEVRTIYGNLESIIVQIRKYILQSPSRMKNDWTGICECEEENMFDDEGTRTPPNLILFDETKSIKSNQTKKSTKSIASTPTQKSELERSVSNIGKTAYKNFILRNIQAVKGESVTRKVFENDIISISTLNSTFSSKILRKNYPPLKETRNLNVNKSIETEKKDSNVEKVLNIVMLENTSFIRRSSCCACQENWRKPLPTPKIPNYKKYQYYDDQYKTNRLKQLSSMINEGLYKLGSYDTKYSMENSNVKIKQPKNPVLPSLVPQNEVQVIAEAIEISPFDLARIRHVIADKETDERLEEFLNNIV